MTKILTPMQYALIWGVTGILMIVHSIGASLDWWALTSPLYYVVLGGLVSLTILNIYEYIQTKQVDKA